MASMARRRDKIGGWCGDQAVRGHGGGISVFSFVETLAGEDRMRQNFVATGFCGVPRGGASPNPSVITGVLGEIERAGRGERGRIFVVAVLSCLRGVNLSKSRGGAERSPESCLLLNEV